MCWLIQIGQHTFLTVFHIRACLVNKKEKTMFEKFGHDFYLNFIKDNKQYLIRSIDTNSILSGTYIFPSETAGLNGEVDAGIQLLKEFLKR